MDPNHLTKPPWTTIAVRRRSGPDLAGGERLAALVHWLRGEASPDDQFFDPKQVRVIANPMEVSWAQFPLQDAMESTPAMADGESSLRRRRTRDPRGSAREQSGRSGPESSDGNHQSNGPPSRSDQSFGGE
jgi:hypothetical protein